MPPVTIKPPSSGHSRSKRNAPPVALPLRLGLMLLALIALVVSVYIGYLSLTGSSLAGCENAESGCNQVLSSVWSKWFNVPVAIPAASLYATVFVAMCFTFGFAPPNVRSGAWKVVSALLLLAALAGIWFIALQALIVKHFCPWCTAVHSCGILLFMLAFALVPFARRSPGLLTAVTTAGLALLIAGQIYSDPPKTHSSEFFEVAEVEPPAQTPPTRQTSGENHTVRRPAEIDEVPAEQSTETTPATTEADPPAHTSTDHTLSHDTTQPHERAADHDSAAPVDTGETPTAVAHNSNTTPAERLLAVGPKHDPINVYAWPILGEPEAEFVILEMFDYCCPHCRHTAPRIEAARARYGDQLAVVIMPMPMNHHCNRLYHTTNPQFRDSCALAQYALCIWRTEPEAFEEFHHWLLEGEDPPSQQNAFNRAKELIGLDPLLASLQESEVDQSIASAVDLYEAFGKGVIPKLVIGNELTAGMLESDNVLFEKLENHFEIEPQN